MAKISTHLKRVAAAIGLARTYADDGALHSSARCLMQAAMHMKKAARQKTRDVEKLAGRPMPGAAEADYLDPISILMDAGEILEALVAERPDDEVLIDLVNRLKMAKRGD